MTKTPELPLRTRRTRRFNPALSPFDEAQGVPSASRGTTLLRARRARYLRALLGTTALTLMASAARLNAQALSPKWEELTASDFVKALDASRATCLLPFGILEKHGPAGERGYTDAVETGRHGCRRCNPGHSPMVGGVPRRVLAGVAASAGF